MPAEAQSHRFSFGEPIGVRAVTEYVCDLALSFGDSWRKREGQWSRPFGWHFWWSVSTIGDRVCFIQIQEALVEDVIFIGMD
jgi:hypothetical protein